MNISIICIGKLKERFWQDAAAEYIKRLGRFCKTDILELPESKSDDAAEESSALLAHIPKGAFVVALDINGKSFSSEALAEWISQRTVTGISHICFIIGGSNGFDDRIRRASQLCLSFSSFTFPHQLMRIMLLEQIYRAFKINSGEKYHK